MGDWVVTTQICEKEKCTGCTACKNICPVNAISMGQNEEGFFYPVIDTNLCVDCKKCQNVCPANHLNLFTIQIQNVMRLWLRIN